MTLRRPSGPYSVGFIDYEWTESSGGKSSEEDSTIEDDYTLVRIFYPSDKVESSCNENKSNEIAPQWKSRSHWIPSPEYFYGFGYYLKLPWLVSYPFFRLMAGNIPIWAVEKAPVLESEEQMEFPLIVFSHGLGTMRTSFTTFCTEMASHGYIVAALEHRDQSAAMSYYCKDGSTLPYEHAPTTGPEDVYKFRSKQLAKRCAEVTKVINLFYDSPECENIWRLSNSKEYATRNDLAEDAFEKLKFKVCKKVLVAGHSFGGATAFLVAQKDPRISAILPLDPFLGPMPKDFLEKQMRRSIPTLVINSESFQKPENLASLKAILDKNIRLDGRTLTKQLTVMGSAHTDQSDLPTIIPYWMLKRFGMGGASEGPSEFYLQRNLDLIKLYADNVFGRISGMESVLKLEKGAIDNGVRLDL